MSRIFMLIMAMISLNSALFADDALGLLRKSVTAEKTITYRGERVTTFPGSRFERILEYVVRDGKRFRSEIRQPEMLRGQIIIDDGSRMLVLKKGEKSASVRPSMQGELHNMTKGLLYAISKGVMEAHIMGSESIAGHSCQIVQITTFGKLTHCLWIDDDTNIPLKQANYRKNGKPRFIQVFTRITCPTKVSDRSFRLPEGVGQHDDDTAKMPKYFDSVADAQKAVDFHIIAPKPVPTDFRSYGVRVYPFAGRLFVSQHFLRDKVNVTIFQTRIKSGSGLRGFKPSEFYKWKTWKRNGIEFGILGNMSDSEMQQFYQAMQ